MITRVLFFTTLIIFSLKTYALDFSGQISKNHSNNNLSFNLTIGDKVKTFYTLNGTAEADNRYFHSYLSFQNVVVSKFVHSGDSVESKDFKNEGNVDIWFRERIFSNATFAGHKIGGKLVSGKFIDSMLSFSSLFVNGVLSKGILDYDSWNGKYNRKSDARFGQAYLSSSKQPSQEVFIIDGNTVSVSLLVGSMLVEGTIQFDKNKTAPGTKDPVTEGSFNTKVTNLYHAEIELPNTLELNSDEEKEVEETVLRIFALFEVIAFDLCSI